MLRKLPAIALTAILATTGTLSLAQEERGFVIRGMGALDCGTLVDALQEEQNDEVAARLIAWLSGYVSHANRAAPEVNDLVPYPNINGFATVVARVCASNRDAQVETVSASALATLTPLSMIEQEDAVELRRDEATVLMRLTVLQGVQERLIARELLSAGSADGVYGDQTAQALREFQEEVGLEPTGLPDAWTVFLLQASE